MVVDYLERMDLAYAAADLALCRAGAVTVAELSAVGLPAAFVPLPIGNGEQRRNALPVIEAGGGLLVEDADLDATWIQSHLVPAAHRSRRARRVRRARGGGRGARRRRAAGRHRADGGGPRHERRRTWRPGRTRCRRSAELGAVHFVGIGGAGMSGIARILLARGVRVSGSDRRDTPTLLALRALGARVEVGHDPAHLGDADTVVVSTAIRATTPSSSAARERGLRVLPRAVALAAVMAGRRSIAVAGTHGKTSTTSMLTVAVQACGVDPSFAIGGDLNESGSNAHAGEGDIFVAEADESDRLLPAARPLRRHRHQRRGRPPGQLRRPRGRRGRLRPVPADRRRAAASSSSVPTTRAPPGSAAWPRRPGCAPTAAAPTPTSG